MRDGVATVDAVVSLTGFSLVGGPAYNDAAAAEAMLAQLDVPYVAAHPVEFQTLEQWQADARGLLPVEATMMVAIPELDGAICPMTFGGRRPTRRCAGCEGVAQRDMVAHHRARRDAGRAAWRASSRCGAARARAAQARGRAVQLPAECRRHRHRRLSRRCSQSLHNTLRALRRAGYQSTCRPTSTRCAAACSTATRRATARTPMSPPASRPTITCRAQRWLDEIERQWGPAPGRQQSDGASLFVLGAHSATCSSACSPPSATKATRCGCCSSAASRRPTRSAPSTAGSREDFGAACGAAFRHAWRAGIHARQAGRPVRRLLARPADRRSAELLSLCLEQPVRGHDRQAPRRRHADQLSHAAGGPCRVSIAACSI